MKTIILNSGKKLSYSEFGDSDSKHLILYCHGFPGTGEEAGIAHKAALKYGLRIISPTRPGIGESSFDQLRTILSWPNIIDQFLTHFEFNKLSLLGVSGGTPYALAYLAQNQTRINKCLIVSGMGPPSSVLADGSMSILGRLPIWCAQHLPYLAKIIIYLLTIISKYSPKFLLQIYRLSMTVDDRLILKKSKTAEQMLKNFSLALAQGTKGIYHDFKLLTNDWGFNLSDITVPVTLLHGDCDNLIPLQVAKNICSSIPKSDLKTYQGRGHFMAFELCEEIIKFFNTTTASEAKPALET